MKRWIAAVLALMMGLSLAACGGKAQTSAKDADAQTEQVTDGAAAVWDGITLRDDLPARMYSRGIVLESEAPIPPCTAVFMARVTYDSPAVLTRWAEDLCADARWLLSTT